MNRHDDLMEYISLLHDYLILKSFNMLLFKNECQPFEFFFFSFFN